MRVWLTERKKMVSSIVFDDDLRGFTYYERKKGYKRFRLKKGQTMEKLLTDKPNENTGAVVMVSLGYMDKNNTEIHAGDIVEDENGNRYEIDSLEALNDLNNMKVPMSFLERKPVKVIGNIYEGLKAPKIRKKAVKAGVLL